MILLDVNVLLYAYDALSPHHERARGWLEATLRDEPLIAISWQTICAFLRISTNRTVLERPMAMTGALEIVDLWLAEPNVHLLTPGDNYWQILKGVILEGQVRGSMVTDAQLAALAIERGAVLCTADRDFARFPGLRWRNPLA